MSVDLGTIDPGEWALACIGVASLVAGFVGRRERPTDRRAPRPRTAGAPSRRAHYSRGVGKPARRLTARLRSSPPVGAR